MANEIEIGLGTSQLRRDVAAIRRELSGMSRMNVSLFSEQDRELLVGAVGSLTDINRHLRNNAEVVNQTTRAQQRLNRETQSYARLETEVNQALQERARLASQRSIGGRARQAAGSVGGAAGGVGSAAGGSIGALGGLLGSPMGMGTGALLAGGAFAASRIRGGMGTFREGIDDRVRLRGQGVGDMDLSDPDRASELGINAQSMRRRRIQSGRIFGREAGTQEQVMGRAGFERGMGLEAGAVTQATAGLRGQFGERAGTEVASKLQATILASGIDDAIGPYLETAATLLGEINDNALASTDDILGVLGRLAATGENTPEQIAKAFSTLQGSVRGATGEQSAFFQQAFATAGIGGGTQGGTKFALESGGLFGLEEESLSRRGFGENTIQNLQGLGATTGFQERGGAILDEIKSLVGLTKDQSIEDVGQQDLVTISRFANNLFGTKGLEGLTNVKLLEDALKGGPEEEKKFQAEVEKQRKSPELLNLEIISNSAAGQTQAIDALSATIKDELGNKFIPIGNAMVSLLTSIDATISYIASIFGLDTPQEGLAEQIKGETVGDQETFDLATGGNARAQRIASESAAEEFSKNQAILDAPKKPGGGRSNERLGAQRRQQALVESSIDVKGFDPGASLSPEDQKRFFKDIQKELKERIEEARSATDTEKVIDAIKNFFTASTEATKEQTAVQKANIEAVRENTGSQRGRRGPTQPQIINNRTVL